MSHAPFFLKAALKAAGPRLRAALLALPLAACGAPSPELPAGAWLAGEAAPFSAFLGQLETLEGTPLAELAATARPRLEGCRRFVAHAPEPALRELASSLRCADGTADAAVPPTLEALRGDRHFAVAVPVSEGLRLTGGGRWADDSLRLDFELPAGAADGDSPAAALLLPRAEPVGPAVLNPTHTLLRGRFGADGGLDLASLVPAGGAGDRLFRLKSQLFSSVVLTGVWELALYAPSAGETIPPAAVAAEVSDRRTATAAMESFLGEVRRVWRLTPPSRFSVGSGAGAAAGACLPDMRFLPGLEPCYVVTEGALVIGWNADTVERAVAAAGGGADASAADPDADASRLEVSLDRFPAAEEILTEALRGTPPETPSVYPWHRLTFTGRRHDGDYRFTVDLEGR